MSLALGAALYGVFRNGDMLVFSLVPKPAFFGSLYRSVHNTAFGDFVVYNVPDGLWFLSGLFALRALWLNSVWFTRYGVVFSIAGLGLEVSQIFKTIPGTFDVLDVLCMGMSAFLESVIYTLVTRRKTWQTKHGCPTWRQRLP
ncbi:MAG: hypothetical protein LBR23_08085 [Spirochaetaceae bacterium]|nr:hypothetical protein [Spirochaetaceae bacterium]